MASIQPRGGKFQLRIKNKVLPRPLFYTFDTMAEAEAFKAQVDGLLKQGVVPQVLMDEAHRYYASAGAKAINDLKPVLGIELTATGKLGGRETEVLRLVASGLTSGQIAEKLGIAQSTVEVHRRNIMRKLRIDSAVGLTHYAIRHRLIPSV